METNTQSAAIQPIRRHFILFEFIKWYYFVAPKNIVEIWMNYLVANIHYFAVPLLLRTLFSFWHRDAEGYGRGFDFERFFRVWSMNMVSRGVGAIVRATTITIGLAAECVIFVFGLTFLMFWLAAPIVLTVAFLYGWKLVFSV